MRTRRHHVLAHPNGRAVDALFWLEWIGPTRIASLGKRLFQVVQDLSALVTLHVRHVMALGHPSQAFVPARPRHVLCSDHLEAVASRAEVEGVVAVGIRGNWSGASSAGLTFPVCAMPSPPGRRVHTMTAVTASSRVVALPRPMPAIVSRPGWRCGASGWRRNLEGSSCRRRAVA